jgi:hypothetical protein
VSTVVSLPCVFHDYIDPVASSLISVSTVVSLPCVSHDCIDPGGFDKQHDIGEYCSLITVCFS